MVVVVVVVDGGDVSSAGREEGEYKASMSEAGLSFETATRRTGLLAGRCRRVFGVDVVGKVDEAAEMRARTVLRFVRRVVVRVMVGWSILSVILAFFSFSRARVRMCYCADEDVSDRSRVFEVRIQSSRDAESETFCLAAAHWWMSPER